MEPREELLANLVDDEELKLLEEILTDRHDLDTLKILIDYQD